MMIDDDRCFSTSFFFSATWLMNMGWGDGIMAFEHGHEFGHKLINIIHYILYIIYYIYVRACSQHAIWKMMV